MRKESQQCLVKGQQSPRRYAADHRTTPTPYQGMKPSAGASEQNPGAYTSNRVTGGY